MKKSIALFTVILCMILTQLFIISCHTPPEKNTQNDGQDSTKPVQGSATDILRFRLQAADTIESNKKWLDKFDKTVSKDKREAREFYKKEIDTLREKNNLLKRDVEEYEDKGEGKWDTFKIRFNQSMKELSKSIRNLKDTTNP